jgi:hypothetical protein
VTRPSATRTITSSASATTAYAISGARDRTAIVPCNTAKQAMSVTVQPVNQRSPALR